MLAGTFVLMVLFDLISERRPTKESAVAVALVILLVAGFPDGLRKRILNSPVDASAVSRIYIIKNALEQFKKSPILGRGKGTYKRLEKFYPRIKNA